MTTTHSHTPPRAATRRNDHHTSREAATRVRKIGTELHNRILARLSRRKALTDEQLESLAEFRSYGPSTIRKRRSELFHAGLITEAGTAINRRGCAMKLWRLAK